MKYLIICLLLILIGCNEEPNIRVQMKYNLHNDTLYIVTDEMGRAYGSFYGNLYQSNSYAKAESVRTAWVFDDMVEDSMRYRAESHIMGWTYETDGYMK